jgi:hypothetical protein
MAAAAAARLLCSGGGRPAAAPAAAARCAGGVGAEQSGWIAFEVGQMHLSLLLSLQIQFLPSDWLHTQLYCSCSMRTVYICLNNKLLGHVVCFSENGLSWYLGRLGRFLSRLDQPRRN